jgi:hypothetical protein
MYVANSLDALPAIRAFALSNPAYSEELSRNAKAFAASYLTRNAACLYFREFFESVAYKSAP